MDQRKAQLPWNVLLSIYFFPNINRALLVCMARKDGECLGQTKLESLLKLINSSQISTVARRRNNVISLVILAFHYASVS